MEKPVPSSQFAGVVVLGLLFAMALPASARAITPDAPTYGCSPPAIGTPESCAAWHNAPVTLTWNWNHIQADADDTNGSNCDSQTFSTDAVVTVTCRVLSKDTMTPAQTQATVHVDVTAPAVTGITASRPPDSGGWWNHPLGFSFSGTDATSGLAGCDPVPFAGPGTTVVGTCRDAAGNVGTRAFPVAYDDKPPSITAVHASAANGGAGLDWTTSSDVVRSDVSRSPGVGGAPSSLVYTGAGKSLRDSGLDNGTRYRYTVTAFDQAGNAATATGSVVPQPWIGLLPPHGSKFRSLPVLHWPRVAGASYYNVQLYRGKHKVYTTWPGGNKLHLRRVVRYKGRRIRLGRGRYRWYVWPGIGARSAHKYGDLAGQSMFRMLR